MKIHPEISTEYVNALAISANEQLAYRAVREIAIAETRCFVTSALDSRATLRLTFDRLLRRVKGLIRQYDRLLGARKPDMAQIEAKSSELKHEAAALRAVGRRLDC